MYRLHKETKGALEFFDDGFSESGEINVRVRVVEELGQFCNALGVRLGLEFESFTLEQGSEFFVVGNDTIVDNCKFPLRIRSCTLSVFSAQHLPLLLSPVRMAVES